MMSHVGHWIGGQEVREGDTMPVVGPADGSTIAHLHVADAATVARAVSAAERAAPA